MGHAAVLVRGPASVFATDRRPGLERGHDPQLGARVARHRGTRRASLLQLIKETLASHTLELGFVFFLGEEKSDGLKWCPHKVISAHIPAPHRLLIKLCWLMEKHAVSDDGHDIAARGHSRQHAEPEQRMKIVDPSRPASTLARPPWPP